MIGHYDYFLLFINLTGDMYYHGFFICIHYYFSYVILIVPRKYISTDLFVKS